MKQAGLHPTLLSYAYARYVFSLAYGSDREYHHRTFYLKIKFFLKKIKDMENLGNEKMGGELLYGIIQAENNPFELVRISYKCRCTAIFKWNEFQRLR